MLQAVTSANLGGLPPLFANLPGLHGCLHAALEGAMGSVFADSPEQPTMALIKLDFYLLGGDAGAADAERTVRGFTLPASVIADTSWEPLLRRVWGDALPDGMTVRRIGARDVRGFGELAESLVYNFDSLDDFVERGVGFGIGHEGCIISGCSSFAISSHSLEFEIQTHPAASRTGPASSPGAARPAGPTLPR